jgi:hypothetical protein
MWYAFTPILSPRKGKPSECSRTGRAFVVGGTAEKVFVQMREHLEQGEYDVDEIMCQQYLFLIPLSGC